MSTYAEPPPPTSSSPRLLASAGNPGLHQQQPPPPPQLQQQQQPYGFPYVLGAPPPAPPAAAPGWAMAAPPTWPAHGWTMAMHPAHTQPMPSAAPAAADTTTTTTSTSTTTTTGAGAYPMVALPGSVPGVNMTMHAYSLPTTTMTAAAAAAAGSGDHRPPMLMQQQYVMQLPHMQTHGLPYQMVQMGSAAGVGGHAYQFLPVTLAHSNNPSGASFSYQPGASSASSTAALAATGSASAMHSGPPTFAVPVFHHSNPQHQHHQQQSALHLHAHQHQHVRSAAAPGSRLARPPSGADHSNPRKRKDAAESDGSRPPPRKRGRRPKPKDNRACVACAALKTPMWRDDRFGNHFCNACGIRLKKYGVCCASCHNVPHKAARARGRCDRCNAVLPAPDFTVFKSSDAASASSLAMSAAPSKVSATGGGGHARVTPTVALHAAVVTETDTRGNNTSKQAGRRGSVASRASAVSQPSIDSSAHCQQPTPFTNGHCTIVDDDEDEDDGDGESDGDGDGDGHGDDGEAGECLGESGLNDGKSVHVASGATGNGTVRHTSGSQLAAAAASSSAGAAAASPLPAPSPPLSPGDRREKIDEYNVVPPLVGSDVYDGSSDPISPVPAPAEPALAAADADGGALH